MRKLLVLIGGFLVGSSVGAAVSLILTPASGKDMRSGARERFQQILDESAQAAAARRAALESELADMTQPTESSDTDESTTE
jgi:gas vesicle protein